MSLKSSVWFPEPSIADDTYARRTEHTIDWLSRSTSPRAKECRRFLREHIARLPLQSQEKFVDDLRQRWHPTFFELVVARILQELGATITVEGVNIDGRRPDFKALFSDSPVIVEVIAPIFNADSGDLEKARIPLLDIIESNIPEGWLVNVWELPDIGLSQSKKDFERTIQRMLQISPPEQNESRRDIVEELSTGLIRLGLIPAGNLGGGLGVQGMITLFDNSKERIRYAIDRKRKQVKSSDSPVLLAIHASGISSDLEDFDITLFGHTFERFDEQGKSVEIGFLPDGYFNRKSEKPPTYAGVLAFLNVGFQGCSEPVLYRHPRFTGKLPEALLQLEQRQYDEAARKIHVVPSTGPNFGERLNFVKV